MPFDIPNHALVSSFDRIEMASVGQPEDQLAVVRRADKKLFFERVPSDSRYLVCVVL